MRTEIFVRNCVIIVGMLVLLVCSGCFEEPAQMSEADLNGTYVTGEFRIENSIPVVYASAFTFDGAGNTTVTSIAQSTAPPSVSISADEGPSEEFSPAYSVAIDGLLSMNSQTQEEAIVGQISTDRNLINFADTYTSGDDIGIAFGIKQSTGMTQADFVGTYSGCQLTSFDTGLGAIVLTDKLTIIADGAGNYTINNDAYTYIVSDNGAVDLDANNVTCQLSADGEELLIMNTGTFPFIATLTRQTGEASISSLNGNYQYICFNYELNSNTFFTSQGTFTSDGTGAFTSTIQRDSLGTIDETATGALSVDSDGSIKEGFSTIGQLGFDGGLFIISKSSEFIDSFMIGIRKP